MKVCFLLFFVLFQELNSRRTVFPWLNVNLTTEYRASCLITALNLDQKVQQLVIGTPAVPELKIPAYNWRNNVLHGLVDNGVSTMFPQAIGMAATWNKKLFSEMGEVIMKEQRIKHVQNVKKNQGNCEMNYGLDLWGPNINMFVHPQWGRGQETYGEDPFLTASLAVPFIKSLQQQDKRGVYASLATLKHFDAYNVDKQPPRLSFDPNITQTDLIQYYQSAFEKIIREAKPRSVMCSYNGINGYPMCMSPLIQETLRNKFKFDGYVVSDSGALDFMVTQFHRFKNNTEAATAGLLAGVDLNSGNIFLKLKEALQLNMITEDKINTALKRVLSARIDAGLFDPLDLSPWNHFDESLVNSDECLMGC